MCGRVVWVWDQEMQTMVRTVVDEEPTAEVQRVMEKKRYNVPPASHLPVIAGADTARMTIARWGFPIPQRPNGVFNTRIETAADSPMWRPLLGKSHCLWPISGFYEWQRHGDRRVPFYISRRDKVPLLLAGLVSSRDTPNASILTCQPNKFMAEIHDRMPVIIEPDDAHRWLGADVETALDLAQPAGDVLTAHNVSTDVNDTKNDAPKLRMPLVGLGDFS